MKLKAIKLLGALLILSTSFMAHGFEGRNAEAHNQKAKSVLANGYDVVSYFPEFEGKAVLGTDEFKTDYKGLTYKFSSQVNMDEFLSNPDRYEPAHGGFCSYAMALGSAGVDVNPKSFILEGDRLFLFAPGTKRRWNNGDTLAQEEAADTVWEDVSGEPARNINY